VGNGRHRQRVVAAAAGELERRRFSRIAGRELVRASVDGGRTIGKRARAAIREQGGRRREGAGGGREGAGAAAEEEVHSSGRVRLRDGGVTGVEARVGDGYGAGAGRLAHGDSGVRAVQRRGRAVAGRDRRVAGVGVEIEEAVAGNGAGGAVLHGGSHAHAGTGL